MQRYAINLFVDNSALEGAPILVESYPIYRNIFGNIERRMDGLGYGWRFYKVMLALLSKPMAVIWCSVPLWKLAFGKPQACSFGLNYGNANI